MFASQAYNNAVIQTPLEIGGGAGVVKNLELMEWVDTVDVAGLLMRRRRYSTSSDSTQEVVQIACCLPCDVFFLLDVGEQNTLLIV